MACVSGHFFYLTPHLFKTAPVWAHVLLFANISFLKNIAQSAKWLCNLLSRLNFAQSLVCPK
jgi:hypothetical protein